MGNFFPAETLPSEADDVLPSTNAVASWMPANPETIPYLRLIQQQTSGNPWEQVIESVVVANKLE